MSSESKTTHTMGSTVLDYVDAEQVPTRQTAPAGDDEEE
jgi:hypothetical protein